MFGNLPERMPLSKDPQKAANQLANLQKGREAAAAKSKSLAVVGYDAPADPPAGKPSPAAAGGENDDGNGGSGGLWVMLAAGVVLLLVLVLLARQGGRDE